MSFDTKLDYKHDQLLTKISTVRASMFHDENPLQVEVLKNVNNAPHLEDLQTPAHASNENILELNLLHIQSAVNYYNTKGMNFVQIYMDFDSKLDSNHFIRLKVTMSCYDRLSTSWSAAIYEFDIYIYTSDLDADGYNEAQFTNLLMSIFSIKRL